jgi:transposase
MGMWNRLRSATIANTPHSAIRFDKFHIKRHLGEVFEKARAGQYKQLNDNHQKVIEGQKETF